MTARQSPGMEYEKLSHWMAASLRRWRNALARKIPEEAVAAGVHCADIAARLNAENPKRWRADCQRKGGPLFVSEAERKALDLKGKGSGWKLWG